MRNGTEDLAPNNSAVLEIEVEMVVVLPGGERRPQDEKKSLDPLRIA